MQVVGISPDSPKVLAKFAKASKITFPLLSDPDSKVIDAYHARNKEARGGVPHPGTFVVDTKGVIRAKLFLGGYRDRHTTDDLVKAAGRK